MSRYGPAGRLARSPLNPAWAAAQPARAAGNAMLGAMPAVSQFGDEMVDKQAPALSKMAGEGVDALLPSLAGALGGGGEGVGGLTGAGRWLQEQTPAIRQMAQEAAPNAAKALGRVGWAGAAGMLGAGGDVMSGEDPSATLANVGRSAMMSMPRARGAGGDAPTDGGLPPPTMSPEMGIEALLRGTPGLAHPGLALSAGGMALPWGPAGAAAAGGGGQAPAPPSTTGTSGGPRVFGVQDAYRQHAPGEFLGPPAPPSLAVASPPPAPWMEPFRPPPPAPPQFGLPMQADLMRTFPMPPAGSALGSQADFDAAAPVQQGEDEITKRKRVLGLR